MNPFLIMYSKKEIEIGYTAEIGISIKNISLRESAGVYIVDVSFVKLSSRGSSSERNE